MINKKSVPIAAFLFLILGITASIARTETDTIGWGELSDKDVSPWGRAALSLDKENWKHAETEHFIYHFMDDKPAETVLVHAEAYYKWIKDFFGVTGDSWKRKSHIFIFTDGPAWDDFMRRIKRPPERRSFTSGWELFIFREPHWVSPRQSLAHELTHVIVFRFMEGPLPLFLDEGISCFASSQLLKMQLESNNYAQYPIKPLTADEYIPIKDIVEITAYPAKNVEGFYLEGEWFVRFLAFTYGNEKFYAFSRAVAQGGDFQKSIEKVYEADFAAMEEKFKRYAIILPSG